MVLVDQTGVLLTLIHPHPIPRHPPHPLMPLCCAVAELEASKAPDARVRRLFVDPLGRHALLTLQSGSSGGNSGLETFYVDGELKKARPLGKLKGLAVTSVAWSPLLRAHRFT